MTNGDINRLGDRIRTSKGRVSDADLFLLQDYRKAFQEPIARVFDFVLKAARKIDRQSIVTYRIKRIDTIIEKVRRYDHSANGPMLLSRMWDIAGCRCIISTPGEEKLYQLLRIIQDAYSIDPKVNDHINPPEPSGYQSLHIYVKDPVSNKRVEIQIRNRRQHNWATLVEIVDLLYGSKQKEMGGTGALGRFLYLYSKASILSDEEFSEFLILERRLRVFERMSEAITRNFLNIRKQWIQQSHQGAYYVISASKKGSEIESFNTFSEAEEYYYNRYINNDDSNIVLTHLNNSDFSQISIAYSNYMLAMHAFFDDYRVIVSKKIVQCIREKSYLQFFRDFSCYFSNIKYHSRNLSKEINSIQSCLDSETISRTQVNNWIKEVKQRLGYWEKETVEFYNSLTRAAGGSHLRLVLIRNRFNRMIRLLKDGQND